MSSKKVIIICWDFPPNQSIGGRRWAKIAKSFLKLNYEIFIVKSANEKHTKKLNWLKPTEFSKLKIYQSHSNFFVNWLHDYSSPFKFIKIKIAGLLLKLFNKGTIFDKTIWIEKKFLNLVEDIIQKEAIETVFVTGAPFNLLYYTAKLKIKFPNVKIIADYRDPWINAQNYGMQNLSIKRMQEEQRKQNYVFENVDIVTAPNTFLLEEIKNTYTGKCAKIANFMELSHAFDPDDVVEITSTSATEIKIKIVYAGTLYLGLESYLTFLNDSISYLNEQLNIPEHQINFYTNELEKNDLFKQNSNSVFFYKSIGDKIFNEIATSDYILILLSGHNKNYLTSKFFEFLPYNKPYLYVGPKGFVSEKIEAEGLGFHLTSVEDLYQIIKRTNALNSSSRSAQLKYSFDFIVAEFISKIQKIVFS